MTWQDQLQAHGFTFTDMGGGIMQWRRCDGEIEELIVHRDADTVITSEDDYVQTWTGTADCPADDPDDIPRPLWALLDAMHGCDCYELINLRVAHAHTPDAHDDGCKCWK